MVTDAYILDTYGKYMNSIKTRLDGIEEMCDAGLSAPVVLEDSIALQLRKIVEALYMSSLCANAEKFEDTWARYKKEYKIGEIKKRLSGDYWPTPVRRRDTTVYIMAEQPFKEETANELLWRCGKMCHNESLFDKEFLPGTDYVEANFALFQGAIESILKHLAHHVVEIDTEEGRSRFVECRMLYEDKTSVWVAMASGIKEMKTS